MRARCAHGARTVQATPPMRPWPNIRCSVTTLSTTQVLSPSAARRTVVVVIIHQHEGGVAVTYCTRERFRNMCMSYYLLCA